MRIAHVLAFPESRAIDFRESSGRVVSYLAEELLRQGHEVAIFDGATSGAPAAAGCDVVHVHLDRAAIPAAWRSGGPPVVATLHAGGGGRPSGTHAPGDVPLVAVSDAQRARLPSLPWWATIPYGIPADAFGFREGRGGYLAVIGAMRPGSGIDRAIEIARRSGRRIRIASRSGGARERYFRTEVAPLLADPHVALVGELNGHRNEFLGDAVALLQLAGSPAHPELTAIEALASGTPVVRCGPFATQESIAEGIVDFAAATLTEAVDAVGRASRLERRRCREVFELRFTAAEMARHYLSLYRAVQRSAPARSIPLAVPATRGVPRKPEAQGLRDAAQVLLLPQCAPATEP